MSKVKTTDKAVKTVESWWALLFAEGGLGHTAFRWAWPVIGGAVGAWVASATDWISGFGVAGWAATIILGALSFIWGAVGIDHFRTRGSRVQRGEGGPVLDAEQVENLINAHFLARESDEGKRLGEALKDIRLEVREIGNEARTGLVKLEDDLKAKTKDLERRWESWTHQHTENNDRRFRNVDGGFRAIHDREVLSRLAGKIEQEAKWLLRTRDGERVEDWGIWHSREAVWRQDIGEYVELAKRYRQDVLQVINDVPAKRLQGDWPEIRELFPSDDAMIAHRTIAVTLQNFTAEHEMVVRCVTSWAFGSPSMKGMADD